MCLIDVQKVVDGSRPGNRRQYKPAMHPDEQASKPARGNSARRTTARGGSSENRALVQYRRDGSCGAPYAAILGSWLPMSAVHRFHTTATTLDFEIGWFAKTRPASIVRGQVPAIYRHEVTGSCRCSRSVWPEVDKIVCVSGAPPEPTRMIKPHLRNDTKIKQTPKAFASSVSPSVL